MIDTAILLVGFVCVALIFSVCALAYGNLTTLEVAGYRLREMLPSTPNVHVLVLAVATVCVITSTVISSQYANIDLIVDHGATVTLALGH